MPGRYVRLVKGSIVVQRHDLQGVVAHLQDLARHLEAMIPSDDDLDKLSRARDFSGGFAARAEFERALDETVLEALADRPDGAPYERLQVEGYSVEQIESAVLRLWKAGLVDAHTTKPEMVVPAALTTRGLLTLQQIETRHTKGGAR